MKFNRQDITNALVLRMDGNVNGNVKLADYSLAEIARRCYRSEHKNKQHTGTDYELVRGSFMFGGSLFSAAFSDALGKILLMSYAEASPNWSRIFNAREVSRFIAEMIEVDPVASPEEVAPGGEFGKTENAEGRTHSTNLRKYGCTFEATFEAILADDVQLLASMIREHVASCIRLEDDKVFEVLQAPPAINSKAFFSATRGNLKTGAALASGTLDAAVQALRGMKLNKVDLRLRPASLLVPPSLEDTARKLVIALFNRDSDPDRIEVVVESRLSGSDWYLAASKSQIESIVLAFLTGQRNPEIIKIPKRLEVDGQLYRVKHTCQAVAAKPSGIILNQV